MPCRLQAPSPRKLIAALGLLLAIETTAFADETVFIGNSSAVLIRPTGTPRGSIILLPGGNGRINAGVDGAIGDLLGNQVVRTRRQYSARGLAVLIVDANTNLAKAVDYMAAIKRPVTVEGTSRGTIRAVQGIRDGARPDALILTSGLLSPQFGPAGGPNVMTILGSPNLLPPTLVIHHRQDGCNLTNPAGVDPFIKWAGGRAKVTWLDGGASNGDPCEAAAHHGFNGLDDKVVVLAVGFH